MDTLNNLFMHPLVPRLGWSLAHFVWQGAVLAGVLALALHLLRQRSPNTRYLAAAATMLLMIVVVPATICLISPGPANLEPAGAWSSAVAGMPTEASHASLFSSEAGQAGEPSSEFTAQPPNPPAVLSFSAENAIVAPAQQSQATVREGPPWQERAITRLHALMPWAVLAWFTGVVMLSIRLTAGWMVVQRLRRRFVEPAGRQLEALVEQIAARLSISRPVRVVRSACTGVPSTLGWLRPVILLPAAALTGLTREQLEAVIAHELAHIRRYDYLINLLQSVVETLLFYHPAVWWVSRRMRIEREHCCDDMAIAVCGNPVTYARALSDLESMRGTPGLLAAVTGGSLVDRVRRILGVNAPVANPFARYAAGLLVSAIVVAFLIIVEISSSRALAEANNNPPASAPAAVESEAAQDAEPNAVQPQRWRHFERIVVGKEAMTFQGKLTDWESIRAVTQDSFGSFGMGGMGTDLSAIRKRNMHTVLELAWESDEVSQEVMDQSRSKARDMSREYGYESLSEIGVHPLSSKGSKSQFLPPLTQSGRWRHFARLTVSGYPEPMFTGAAAGDRGLGRMVMGWHGLGSIVAGLPEPQWTVLEVVAAPNSLTPEEYAERLQRVREQLKEAGLEAVKGVGVLPWAVEPTPSEFIPDQNQPGYWRHYVTLVVGPDAMTFEGRPVNQEQLRDRLEAVPNKSETVLCIAAASEDLNEQTVRRQVGPALQNLGYNHVSYIGVQPLGTKGGPSIFTPTTGPAEPGTETDPSTGSAAKAPPTTAGPASLEFPSGPESLWEAHIDAAQSPEEARSLRLQRDHWIAQEQFGPEADVTKALKRSIGKNESGPAQSYRNASSRAGPETQPAAVSRPNASGITAALTPAGLELHIPDNEFQAARNDEAAERFKPLLEGEPSLKFDTPKTQVIRREATVITPRATELTQHEGVILFLRAKNIFYFWGASVDRDGQVAAHLYGPFPGDALKRLGLDSSPALPAAGELQDSKVDSERLEELMGMLTHPDDSVRKQAVRELGEMKDRRAVPGLIAALKDSDSVVRSRASAALAQMPDPRALGPLVERLENDDDGRVRSYAATALGQLPGERTSAVLVAALRDNNAGVRKAAAQSLKTRGWSPTDTVQQVWYEIGLGETDKAARISPNAQVNPDSHSAEGRLEYNVPYVVRLEASAGDAKAEVDWIEFMLSQGHVSARLAVSYPSGPRAKWRVLVQLLDDAGRALGEEGALIENSGVILGLPVIVRDTHKLDFGAEREMPGLVRFRIALTEVKDDDMAEHARLDPPAVFQGTVTDSDGRPLAGAKLHAYTGHATWRPLHPVSEFVTDAQGRFRIEVIAAAAAYNGAARRWDPAIGIRLEHPGYQPVGDDFWTGRMRGIAGRITTQDFQMSPVLTTQPTSAGDDEPVTLPSRIPALRRSFDAPPR